MAVVDVANLTKIFGDVVAVDNLSFDVEKGEILAIVGASGCGKTTTLRCIAGLDQPTDGTIHIDGHLVASRTTMIPPEQRGIGMVFQSYALWPHMTVFENIAYGLKIKGFSKVDRRAAVDRVLRLVGLEGLEKRYPSELSGGQQQRVALARSAVAEPKVLLLDEPLSNLDAKLRDQMRNELQQMIKRLGTTAIYITHDQTEAMVIADHIVVMQRGKAEQFGTGRELYSHPDTKFVAKFIGASTSLDGYIDQDGGGGEVHVKISEALGIWCRYTLESGQNPKVTLFIRPETVALSESKLTSRNTWMGVIRRATFLGGLKEYDVEIARTLIKVHSFEDIKEGSSVFISIEPARVICLPSGSEGDTAFASDKSLRSTRSADLAMPALPG